MHLGYYLQDWLQQHVEASCKNGNIRGEGENSKFGGFQDLQLVTCSRIQSSRQDCTSWEMPLQWLLIHATQHKRKMQSKTITTVSLCGCIALGCACCLYSQKYNQNYPWIPADRHTDAAAPANKGQLIHFPPEYFFQKGRWSLLCSTTSANTHTKLQVHSPFVGLSEAVSLTVVFTAPGKEGQLTIVMVPFW